MDKLRFFLRKVNITNKCWKWIGAKSEKGYGYFYYKGSISLAHRISYEIFKGKLIKGLEIDHICNNPSCVNPKHLRQVSHSFNVLRGKSRFSLKNNSDFNVYSSTKLFSSIEE